MMSNTVITNFRDASGPRSSADSPFVVVLERDGTISLDNAALDGLVAGDGSQSAGLSVVRVAQDGKPDDATDTENEDDSIPHVTVTVDGFHDDPNGIAKYDSGIEMLQSLSNETREHSLIGFQNDHCYTPLTSSQNYDSHIESEISYDEQAHSKPAIPSSKKITILEQQIIPKGKKLVFNPVRDSVVLKGSDVLKKPLPGLSHKSAKKSITKEKQNEESSSASEKTESSGGSISGESVNDRDSDADYKYARDSLSAKTKKPKATLKGVKKPPKTLLNPKQAKLLTKSKPAKSLIRQDIKEKLLDKKSKLQEVKRTQPSILGRRKHAAPPPTTVPVQAEEAPKLQTPKPPKIIKKEKKTPAHMTALLSDMTTLFSAPDVIRTVPDVKTKPDKNKESEPTEFLKTTPKQGSARAYRNKNMMVAEQIPQIDDASLARLLQEPHTTEPTGLTATTTANPLSSPNIGPLSPTLDLLAGLHTEEEGLTEDLLMHVAQLVESSENLQEVIDKQVLGKVDTALPKSSAVSTPVNAQTYAQAQANAKAKLTAPRKDPIQIVRSDGRVITLPPIEAPATRSKRKSQGPPQLEQEPVMEPPPPVMEEIPAILLSPKQYSNKKLSLKKPEPAVVPEVAPQPVAPPPIETPDPTQPIEESLNSEDDPYRLWCICKQPHNNRFMICCDRCEDWFHGKCVNISKSMGQQMEEQGVEWTCPNCINKMQNKSPKTPTNRKSVDSDKPRVTSRRASEAPAPACIVCDKSARPGSIYCGNACILKHAQESLNSTPKEGEKVTESRIIVFERRTGKVLQGANAPTAENLKTWLQQHPTFEVVRRERENKPLVNVARKPGKPVAKVQTTLKFDRQQKQIILLQPQSRPPQQDPKQLKSVPISPRDISPKTPNTKQNLQKPSQLKQTLLINKDGTLAARVGSPKQAQVKQITGTPKILPPTPKQEPRKTPAKFIVNRQQSTQEKTMKSPPTPVTKTRKEKEPEPKQQQVSTEPIRENVRKALHEHMTARLAETKGVKFTDEEIREFAQETELEMYNLFRDVSMKYKAKYRSLIFNIKDRKNLTLWQKICNRSITPKKLVHLSAEELASQELAQWRDKEAKHQLELIKKSELDLLTASKTYVLKTHKGEEVMEQKSIAAEVDPNVPVEDLVSALNDSQKTAEDKSTKSKHSKQKELRRKSPNYGTPTRSSSRHKSSKEEKSKSKKRSNKDEYVEERKSRREKRRSRDKSRDKSRSKSDKRSRSKDRSRSRHRSKSRGRSRTRRRSSSKTRSSKRKSGSVDKSLRSLSQDNRSKDKFSSKDDIGERPKSALQKEIHPEYDPHEPMITSAFSEEDVRSRSREASFDEGYPDEIDPELKMDEEYDPTKTLSFDVNAPPVAGSSRSDRVPSEVESDQEPSSTCDAAAPPVWSGLINMEDVARFYVSAHQVSGNSSELEDDLSPELEIVGRINPATVWEYIGKMHKTSNKDILVLKLLSSPVATVEERMQYIALYSYLSSRNRLGVVKVTNTSVKDFYIFPLAATESLPPVLLPLDGPGLEEARTHLLFALIVRQKKKRSAAGKLNTVAPKVSRRSLKRTSPGAATDSYTPPTSPAPAPARPARRATPLRLPLPFVPPSPALSTSVKDKIAASLENADEDEAYSPGGSTSSGEAGAGEGDVLRSRVDEINRQIEEQKQQILSIASATHQPAPEDEAYSPSRPISPPAPRPALADIALPSNLHEILATIQQRSQPPPPPLPAADVDMRLPPAPSAPPPPPRHLHSLSEEELLRMVPDNAK